VKSNVLELTRTAESHVLLGVHVPGPEHVPDVVEWLLACQTQCTVSPALMVVVLVLLTVSVNAKLLMLTVCDAEQEQAAASTTIVNLKTRMSRARFIAPAPAGRFQPHFFASKIREEVRATISKVPQAGKCCLIPRRKSMPPILSIMQ
jgi:hypothetical protein